MGLNCLGNRGQKSDDPKLGKSKISFVHRDSMSCEYSDFLLIDFR
jgi:hypothetical protein